MNSNLNWKNHIDELIKKLRKVTGILYRLQHLIPLDCKLKIFYSIFYSHLNYANVIWGKLNKTNKAKINILFNKIIKNDKKSPSTNLSEFVQLMKILKPELLHKHRILLILHYRIYKNIYADIIKLDLKNII